MEVEKTMTTACKCPGCTKTPAATYSPAWMLTAEARFVLTLPFDGARYLDKLTGVRLETLNAEIKRLKGLTEAR